MKLGAITEKWKKEHEVPEKERGKYKGKPESELRSALSKLKKSGPHKEGSAEYERMKELQFAIRAKTGWGKVSESEEELDDMIDQFLNEWYKEGMTAVQLEEVDVEELISEMEE